MGIEKNEISLWEAQAPAGTRLVGAGGILLRCRRLSRHLRHNLVREAALRDRAPTAAETPGPGRSEGRPTGPSWPRSSPASPGAQPGPARPRSGTGAFTGMDFTGAAKESCGRGWTCREMDKTRAGGDWKRLREGVGVHPSAEGAFAVAESLTLLSAIQRIL